MIVHRHGRIAALITATALFAAACSGGGSSAAPSAAASVAAPSVAPTASTAPSASASAAASAAAGPNVVFIPKAVNNPYFDAAALGGQKAATELNGQFTQVGGQNAKADEQIPFIQDATTKGYNAIVVSATDGAAIAPALMEAKAANIKVVGYDSSPAAGAYDVFVNQTDFSLIGGAMAQWACDLAPDCAGDIAILSATATATNQNAWIKDMVTALKDPKFAKLKLVDTVYGNDDPTESTTQAGALISKYKDLKVIVAPTTVGILAAAQVVKQKGLTGKVAVTGLGLPNDMKAFVADGTSPEFGLWDVPSLGYLSYYVAAYLLDGTITGAPGETFTVPGLNDGKPYTIGPDSVVILGPPFVFNKDNVNDFNF